MCMCVCADREDGGSCTQQQQSVVMSLRHIGHSDALDHQLHAELILIQDVCRGNHSQSQTLRFLCHVSHVLTHLQPQCPPQGRPCGRH